MPEFTDEQLGKRVVAQNGSTIGKVTDVRHGDLWVTIDADADRDVLDELHWTGVVNQETERLNHRYISTIREQIIRLGV
ncbi:MAG: hypothetical protein ABEI77_04430 [Halorientalis sp.]